MARYPKSNYSTTWRSGPQGLGNNEFRPQSFPVTVDPDSFLFHFLFLTYLGSRFKLKFSPDKVDTMVVQAIALLDDLDKEINIYAMRVKVCSYLYSLLGTHRFTGMVRLALPRNGQNHHRQHRICKSHPSNGYAHRNSSHTHLIPKQASEQMQQRPTSPPSSPKTSKLYSKQQPRSRWAQKSPSPT